MGLRAAEITRVASVFAFASVAVFASAVVSKRGGYLCENRFCLSAATKHYQDGPNAEQYPTRWFCDACYRAHAERRRALYLHVDWENRRVLYGNQLFENGRLQKSEVQAVELTIDGK